MSRVSRWMAVAAMAGALLAPAAYAADPAPAAPAAVSPAVAGTSAAFPVVIIDPERVIQESKAGKAVRSQMQGKIGGYDKTIGKEKQDIYAAREELLKQQTILGQEALDAKMKDLQQRWNSALGREEEARRTLSYGEQQALVKIDASMKPIIEEIAKERGATLILQRTLVLMFDPKLDATDEVIKRLDDKLPTLAVSFDTPPPPAGGAAAPAPIGGSKPATGAPAPAKKKQ
jgi:outer membrane protein